MRGSHADHLGRHSDVIVGIDESEERIHVRDTGPIDVDGVELSPKAGVLGLEVGETLLRLTETG